MRFYHRTQQDKVDTAYNRCFRDAKGGRVGLALLRLQDLADEFPKDAHVTYAEALIRKDYLGQGIRAQALFKKAYQMDDQFREAACNATRFAPNEEEFRIWAAEALKVAPNDKKLLKLVDHQRQFAAQGLPYWRFLLESVPSPERGQYGTIAALLKLVLHAGAGEISPREKVNCRRVRADSLRALDRAAEDRLQVLGEQFLPEDRFALQTALTELEKAQSDESSEAFYDPELWNLRSAWAYLMRRYEQALTYADQAIQHRPTAYALPHLNKALALWELGRDDQALACAQEALRHAKASQNVAHQTQVQQAIQHHAARKDPTTLEELYPYLELILYGAGNAAESEISDQRGKLEDISESLFQRVRIVGRGWSLVYVPILAELLSFYSPEAVFFIVGKAAEREPSLIDDILNAALFLTGYSEGVLQRDSARFLALEIISPLQASAIRKMYRQGILEVAAAATDELSRLDSLLRKELMRMHPLFPTLIADQKPVDADGRARAARTILPKFIGDASQFAFAGATSVKPGTATATATPMPCTVVFLVLFLVPPVLYLVGRLLGWW